MAHDFKRLDVERAKIATALQSSHDLVAQWMGSASDDSEDEISFKTVASATAGLGAAPERPVLSDALTKLQRAQTKKSAAKKPAAAPQPAPSGSDSEGESRTAAPAKKRRHLSALDAYKLRKKKR